MGTKDRKIIAPMLVHGVWRGREYIRIERECISDGCVTAQLLICLPQAAKDSEEGARYELLTPKKTRHYSLRSSALRAWRRLSARQVLESNEAKNA